MSSIITFTCERHDDPKNVNQITHKVNSSVLLNENGPSGIEILRARFEDFLRGIGYSGDDGKVRIDAK